MLLSLLWLPNLIAYNFNESIAIFCSFLDFVFVVFLLFSSKNLSAVISFLIFFISFIKHLACFLFTLEIHFLIRNGRLQFVCVFVLNWKCSTTLVQMPRCLVYNFLICWKFAVARHTLYMIYILYAMVKLHEFQLHSMGFSGATTTRFSVSGFAFTLHLTPFTFNHQSITKYEVKPIHNPHHIHSLALALALSHALTLRI